MGNFIVNIGNFIDEKRLSKVSSTDFRIIPFEVLLMVFIFDFERILISCVWLLLHNHYYFPANNVVEKNLRNKLFKLRSKNLRTIFCESVLKFLLLISNKLLFPAFWYLLYSYYYLSAGKVFAKYLSNKNCSKSSVKVVMKCRSSLL